ncbi:MAG: hypothetical protein WBA22_04645 [Candidatus Methanofastidiosia archaeon]
MNKIPVLVLMFCISALSLEPQPQENRLPAGKELSILLSGAVTDYQAVVQDFLFQQKLLRGASHEFKLSLLEVKADELAGIILELDMHRVFLIQSLQEGRMAAAEFAVEMHKLAAEVSALARSMGILGQNIYDIVVSVPVGLQGHALLIIGKFNATAGLISRMGAMISEEMDEQGFDSLPLPEIPVLPEQVGKPEDTGEGLDDTGKPEDTGKKKGKKALFI